MARLYPEGGVWYAYGYWHDGARFRRWHRSTRVRVGGAKERKAAESIARDLEVSIAGGAARPRPKAPTVPQAIEMLIEQAGYSRRSPATVEKLTQKGARLTAFWPTTRLPDIDAQELQRYVQAARSDPDQKRGDHTIRMELQTLRQAWRAAQRAEKVAEPPPPIPDLGKYYIPRDRWLPREEMLKLLAALNLERRDYVVTMAQTGMDKGELEALTARHCDFARGVIRVPGTKNVYRQNRIVPMTDEVREVLAVRARGNTGPLFRAWGRGNATRDLRAACKRAEIDDCSLKDLRRTFASEHAARGTPLLVLQKLMGHADGRMLARVYAQFADSTIIESADRVPSYRVVHIPGRNIGKIGRIGNARGKSRGGNASKSPKKRETGG